MSFSQNCDIKTTTCIHDTVSQMLYFGKVTSKNSNKFKTEHKSALTSHVAIFCDGRKKKHSKDFRSIHKQIGHFFTISKDLMTNFFPKQFLKKSDSSVALLTTTLRYKTLTFHDMWI